MHLRSLRQLTPRSALDRRSAGAETETIIETRESGRRASPRSAARLDTLDEFYDAYAARAYGLALRVLGGDQAKAEDIVVETFAAVRQSKSRTAEGETTDLECLLLRQIRKRCLDTLRGRQGVLDGEEANGLPTRSDALVTRNGAVPTSQTVRDALDGLSLDQRVCIERALFQGQTSTEIAGETGISKVAVHHAMRSGLRLLRNQLSANRTENPADSPNENTSGVRG